jgi:hypothetical protein
MKIIKKGTPYRKHKCSKCKSIYVYHAKDDKNEYNGLIYCPVCNNFMDYHFYDRKISIKDYNEIKERGEE